MQVNLCFEGPGRSGKTSLINLLMDTFPGHFEYLKMPVPTSRAMGIKQFAAYTSYLLEADRPVIYDRGHISELVYAPLFRSYVNVEYLRKLYEYDFALTNSNLPTIIVYVYPMWQSIMKLGGRETDDLVRVPVQFESIIHRSDLDVVRITKHRSLNPAWRDQGSVLNELVSQIHLKTEA